MILAHTIDQMIYSDFKFNWIKNCMQLQLKAGLPFFSFLKTYGLSIGHALFFKAATTSDFCHRKWLK